MKHSATRKVDTLSFCRASADIGVSMLLQAERRPLKKRKSEEWGRGRDGAAEPDSGSEVTRSDDLPIIGGGRDSKAVTSKQATPLRKTPRKGPEAFQGELRRAAAEGGETNVVKSRGEEDATIIPMEQRRIVVGGIIECSPEGPLLTCLPAEEPRSDGMKVSPLDRTILSPWPLDYPILTKHRSAISYEGSRPSGKKSTVD